MCICFSAIWLSESLQSWEHFWLPSMPTFPVSIWGDLGAKRLEMPINCDFHNAVYVVQRPEVPINCDAHNFVYAWSTDQRDLSILLFFRQ